MKKAVQPLAILLIVLIGIGLGTMVLRRKPVADANREERADGAAKPSTPGEPDRAAEKGEPGTLGRVDVSDAKVQNAGLVMERAAPIRIKTLLRLYGKVAANEDQMAHVMARFPGIVKAVRKRLGDAVAKGETLATVESNDSLRPYDIKSEIAGTVTAKDATLGELVNDQKPMFIVADLSSVWVDLNVYREDFPQLKVGQKVFIDAGVAGALPLESKVFYLSPLGSENTQSLLARALVPNSEGLLRPGLFVDGSVVTGEEEVPVAVKADALQTLDQKTVVFVREDGAFEARTVELGRRDPEWVEIVSGVQSGEPYAAANSFILKAELGKASAPED